MTNVNRTSTAGRVLQESAIQMTTPLRYRLSVGNEHQLRVMILSIKNLDKYAEVLARNKLGSSDVIGQTTEAECIQKGLVRLMRTRLVDSAPNSPPHSSSTPTYAI